MAITAQDNIQDHVLIRKAREGDVSSFSALVRLYERRAVHIAYSFLGNREDARDAAQEAFVKIYENLSRFRGDSQFSTWFYRILVNTCKDFLKKKRIKFVNPEEEDNVPEKETDQPDALEALLNKELGSSIRQALDKLPFQQRSAFTLRYLEGLSLQEIAYAMDLTEGAVKAHLWQAQEKMKKNLTEWFPNPRRIS
ncbi:MAG: RNA polymerase sigma factor [Candidatus Omnitrophica bacterium]|nr:RNA polymerase sigma factor [Candidatus Omnitrophota bacterium]